MKNKKQRQTPPTHTLSTITVKRNENKNIHPIIYQYQNQELKASWTDRQMDPSKWAGWEAREIKLKRPEKIPLDQPIYQNYTSEVNLLHTLLTCALLAALIVAQQIQ